MTAEAHAYDALSDTRLAALASAGDVEAAHALGTRRLAVGDLARAEPWLQRAADLGHVEAMEALTNLLWRTDRIAEAITLACDAAERGSARAHIVMAAILGLFTETADDQRAVLRHLHLAERCDPTVRDQLEAIYSKITRVPEMAEAKAATETWRRSAH